MIGFIVVAVLAVLIFIGLKNKKKVAQKKSTEEKANVERAEQQKVEKEKAIEAFWASHNLDEELDYIFSVLEKNGASANNFEKGIEHFITKTETTLTKAEIIPTMKKALFARAFDGNNCTVAKAVAVDYFIQDVVRGEMLTQYMRFAISRAKFSTAEMTEPFIKALYGVSGRAFNYYFNSQRSGDYEILTSDKIKAIIESSDVLKSYTDTDPFTADTVRETWAKDMCDSPLSIVRSSKLSDMLDKEEYIDELCYFAYTILRKDEKSSGEGVCVTEIAVAYSDYLKEIYDRIAH